MLNSHITFSWNAGWVRKRWKMFHSLVPNVDLFPTSCRVYGTLWVNFLFCQASRASAWLVTVYSSCRTQYGLLPTCMLHVSWAAAQRT